MGSAFSIYIIGTSMKRVFVAGHKGMVGSAVVRQLSKDSSVEVITKDRDDLNLLDTRAVEAFFCDSPY